MPPTPPTPPRNRSSNATSFVAVRDSGSISCVSSPSVTADLRPSLTRLEPVMVTVEKRTRQRPASAGRRSETEVVVEIFSPSSSSSSAMASRMASLCSEGRP